MGLGIGLNFHFTIGETDAALLDVGTRLDAAGLEFVEKAGLILEAAIKDRAPVKTGTLRRSVGVDEVAGGAGVFRSTTGPRTKYGRRLELGFHGADSLGRIYDQSGKPYVAPAIDASVSPIGSLLQEVMSKAIGA